MNTRIDKYYEKNTSVPSRTTRNSDLYKEISKTELENFEVRSNATIIGNNRGSIDVEKIKSILDTHYNDVPKRRTIQIEPIKKEEKTKSPVFETKEYDINVILDKAKEDKLENYGEDRAKKLRDTQFDILSNLNINREDFIEDYDGDSITTSEKRSDSEAAKKLEELINTIALNEQDVKKEKQKLVKEDTDTNPLDIFEDLKGDENTVTLEGLQEKTENLIKKIESTTSLDNSFFTKSNSFKKTDFEDFRDIEEKEGSIIIKIIIFLLIAVFIAGVVILIKSFM